MLCQFLHQSLTITAVFDAVIHTSQYTSRVGNGFFHADLRTFGQIRRVSTLVKGCHFECTTRTGRSLFKNQRNILTLQKLRFLTGTTQILQLGGQFHQEADFLTGEVGNLQEIAIFKAHDLLLKLSLQTRINDSQYKYQSHL